jgi:hypothetical protein
MHEFPTLEATELSLNALIARSPDPLVVRLARQAGMKELRYAHLLCGEPQVPAPEAAAAPPTPAAASDDGRLAKLEHETASLRAEVADLRRELTDLRKQLE